MKRGLLLGLTTLMIEALPRWKPVLSSGRNNNVSNIKGGKKASDNSDLHLFRQTCAI